MPVAYPNLNLSQDLQGIDSAISNEPYDVDVVCPCLIRTDVAPKILSGLGKIWIMQIGSIRIGKDWDLPMCPV